MSWKKRGRGRKTMDETGQIAPPPDFFAQEKKGGGENGGRSVGRW